MAINFFPAPTEILPARYKLTVPATRSKPERLIRFSEQHKICLFALCQLLNPLLDRGESEQTLSYKDISVACNIPVSTLKRVMPVLAYNFPKYFRVKDRTFGKGYIYEFHYKFELEGKRTVADDELTAFLKGLDENDFYKWEIFKQINLKYENKRLFIFKRFMSHEISFWERNIAYTRQQGQEKNWSVVPNPWLWRCLEQDFGKCLIQTIHARRETINDYAGVKRINNILQAMQDKMKLKETEVK